MAHCYFLLAPQIKVKLRLHNGLKFSDRRICEKCGNNGGLFDTNLPILGEGLSSLQNTTAIITEIQNSLANLLQPGLLLTAQEIADQLSTVPYLNVEVISETENGVEFALSLDGTTNLGQINIAPDLGLLDDFGLNIDAKADVNLTYNLDGLRFGVNQDQAYLHKDDSDLEILVEVGLPDASFHGDLGCIPISFDLSDTFPSSLAFDFNVDLSGFDYSLDFSQLGNISLFDFDFALPDGTIDLPGISGDFTLNLAELGNIDFGDPSYTDYNIPFAFDNIELDLGSLYGDFLEPVLDNINAVFDPIRPFIEIFNIEIPLVSNLPGASFLDFDSDGRITFRDLAELEARRQGININFELIDTIIEFSDFIANIPTVGNVINIGEININDLGNVSANPTSFNSPNLDLPSGFNFPLLDDPLNFVYDFIFGNPTELITYRTPEVDFSINPGIFVPIIGPLGVRIEGNLGFNAQFGFGFDTYGLTCKDGTHLAFEDGFYISDTANLDGTGEDIPEAVLTAGLGLDGGVDLEVVKAFVGGDINGEIFINLNDPNGDGKIRSNELDLSNPSNIFDPIALDNIYAQLSAWYQIFPLDKVSFPLSPQIPLLNKEQLDSASNEITGFVDQIKNAIEDAQDFLGNVWKEVEKFAGDVANAVKKGVEDLIDFGSDIGQAAVTVLNTTTQAVIDGKDAVLGVLADFDEQFIQPFVEGIGLEPFFTYLDERIPLRKWLKEVNNAIDDLGEYVSAATAVINGNTTVKEIIKDIPKLYTFSAEIIDGQLEINWDSNASNQYLQDPKAELYVTIEERWGLKYLQVFSAPIKSQEKVARIFKAECGGFLGTDCSWNEKTPETKEVEHRNAFEFNLNDINKIVINGTNYDDKIIVDKLVDTPVTIKAYDGRDTIQGGSNDDDLQGGRGDDTIIGGEGHDTIGGDEGNDVLVGGDTVEEDNITGNDSITGGTGNDTLIGGAGEDTLKGDDDNDVLRGGDDKDKLYGGDGEDNIYGEGGNDTASGGGQNDYIEGGEGDDSLNGDGGEDYILGQGGEDTLNGGIDNDQLDGGDDDDHLYGDSGNDFLQGGEDNDHLYGWDDNDVLEGGLGNDEVSGGSGDDDLYGDNQDATGNGWDVLKGGRGDDYLKGGGGNDNLDGNEDADLLEGDDGDDILRGGKNDDTDANDILRGGDGEDELYGGNSGEGKGVFRGGVTLEGNNSAQYDFLDGEAGKDKLFGEGGTNYLRSEVLSDYSVEQVAGGDELNYFIIDLNSLANSTYYRDFVISLGNVQSQDFLFFNTEEINDLMEFYNTSVNFNSDGIEVNGIRIDGIGQISLNLPLTAYDSRVIKTGNPWLNFDANYQIIETETGFRLLYEPSDLPGLKTESLSISDTTLKPDQTYELDFAIRNYGNSNADPFKVDFYLSKNSNPSDLDPNVHLGTYEGFSNGLVSRSTVNDTQTIELPEFEYNYSSFSFFNPETELDEQGFRDGSQRNSLGLNLVNNYLISVVDFNNEVTEFDDSYTSWDRKIIPITIDAHKPADLSFDYFRVRDDINSDPNATIVTQPGQLLDFNYTIQNTGDFAVEDDFVISYYLSTSDKTEYNDQRRFSRNEFEQNDIYLGSHEVNLFTPIDPGEVYDPGNILLNAGSIVYDGTGGVSIKNDENIIRPTTILSFIVDSYGRFDDAPIAIGLDGYYWQLAGEVNPEWNQEFNQGTGIQHNKKYEIPVGEILAGTAVSHLNFINTEGDFKEVYLGEPDININLPDWNHSIWDTVGEGTYYLHTVIDGNHDVGERNGLNNWETEEIEIKLPDLSPSLSINRHLHN